MQLAERPVKFVDLYPGYRFGDTISTPCYPAALTVHLTSDQRILAQENGSIIQRLSYRRLYWPDHYPEYTPLGIHATKSTEPSPPRITPHSRSPGNYNIFYCPFELLSGISHIILSSQISLSPGLAFPLPNTITKIGTIVLYEV